MDLDLVEQPSRITTLLQSVADLLKDEYGEILGRGRPRCKVCHVKICQSTKHELKRTCYYSSVLPILRWSRTLVIVSCAISLSTETFMIIPVVSFT